MDKTVLITGASSGIGKALAHEFAGAGYDVVGVARTQEKLDELKDELQDKFGIKVFTVQKDLATDEAAGEVYQEVKQTGRTVNILVNNAGVGQRGKFVDIPSGKNSELIHLNMMSLTHLTKLYLKEMVERNEGKILTLGSISGFQPGPLMAVYHATKAYVISFSEAIATELDDMGSDVTITCLCPGPTDTDSFSRGDMEDTIVVQFKDEIMQSPEEVAKGAYEALMEGERIYIPGALNKVMAFVRRVIPRKLQAKIQKKFYEMHEE